MEVETVMSKWKISFVCLVGVAYVLLECLRAGAAG